MAGAVNLTDAALFKAPIIFMEPVAGSTKNIGVASKSNPAFLARGTSGGNMYTRVEVQRLRKYIAEKRGFLYILTHGNAPVAMRSAYKVLRAILPEHPLQPVPNKHEIYRSFYQLGGPLKFPIRPDWGVYSLYQGKYSELQGIYIDADLGVLVDTEEMMHILDCSTQHPFKSSCANWNKIMDEFTPAATRQMINIIVYAMTHGGISDYSNYVPESARQKTGN